MFKKNKMKRLTIIFVICAILLMTFGIVLAESAEESIKEDLEKIGKNVKNITKKDDGFYEVDIGEGKPVFAITYSVQKTPVEKKYFKSFLNFGFNGKMNKSGFLKTSTGIESALNKGYIMINKGSITGISTNLEVLDSIDLGQIEVIIYKNEEQIGFRNTLSAKSSGIKKDYDIQSENIVMFEPGDIISVYAKANNEIIWKDVITMVEITFAN